MRLDLASVLNLISTIAIVAAPIFTPLQETTKNCVAPFRSAGAEALKGELLLGIIPHSEKILNKLLIVRDLIAEAWKWSRREPSDVDGRAVRPSERETSESIEPARSHQSPVIQIVRTWKLRRGRESNPRIAVLQTAALPLGYPAGCVRTHYRVWQASVNRCANAGGGAVE